MYPIKQSFLKVNPYTRPGKKLDSVKGIVIHWTANENTGADDVAHYRYFNASAISSKSYASAHFFVDHDSILQIIPEDEVAYHVGAKTYRTARLGSYPNATTIGVETCVNYKGENFKKALDQSAQLVAHLLNKHKLKITALYRHYDVTGKDCPRYFVNNATAKAYGLGDSSDKAWKWFLGLVATYMKSKEVVQKPVTTVKGSLCRVVSGSFSDRKNAETRIKALEKKGFKSFLLVEGKNFRVITGSFSERVNADKQIKELKDKGFDAFVVIYGEDIAKPTPQPKPQPKPETPKEPVKKPVVKKPVPSKKEDDKKMVEKAILPINQTRITAGYKSAEYLKSMGFPHYGIDMTDDNKVQKEVYAPFKMKVTHVGYDNLMGHTVIGVSVGDVDVHNGPKKGARRLVVRFAHLEKTFVKVGDIVAPESAAIALYGMTGTYGNAPHLHMELDTDINYPNYSPTLKSSSNIWKAGTDSTIQPMDALKVDANGDRGFKQTFGYEKDYASWMGMDDRTTLTLDGKIINATAL